MKDCLQLPFQKFPASILLLVLLVISMWANKRYSEDITQLCGAGGILFVEGSIAWEGLADLAPRNLERNDERWRWARDQIRERCENTR